MSVDIFGIKSSSVTMPSGVNASQFNYTMQGGKNFYKNVVNLGDMTISADTTIATTLDDPEVTHVFIPNLTVNAGKVLTAANRCAGLIIWTNNLVLNGTITMKSRGGKCKKSLHGLTDLTIPNGVTYTFNIPKQDDLTTKLTTVGARLDYLLANALSVTQTITPGEVVLVPSIGGAGGSYTYHNSTAIAGPPGVAGSTIGLGATGGGGAGGVWATSGNGWQQSGGGTKGTVTGGGSGGGACGTNSSSSLNAENAIDYNGKGGNPGPAATNQGAGAGNPSGINTGTGYLSPEEGVGGILGVVCLNSCTISATGYLIADGSNGGGGNYGGGGGSGGGSVFLIYNQAGTYSNSGTLRANGGVSANSSNGGAGGAGSTRILRFADMGSMWT